MKAADGILRRCAKLLTLTPKPNQSTRTKTGEFSGLCASVMDSSPRGRKGLTFENWSCELHKPIHFGQG